MNILSLWVICSTFLLFALLPENLSMADVSNEIRYSHIYALVVGIDKYENSYSRRNRTGWTRLNNAQRDVQRFSTVLQKQFGAKMVSVWPLLGKKATRGRILAAMGRLEDEVSRHRNQPTLLIFYFSGHGATVDNRGYIIPYDGASSKARRDTWIAEAEIATRANELNSIRHQIYVFSSCFSGGMARDGTRENKKELQSRHQAALWFGEELGRRARVAIVAAESNQVVLDGEPGQGSNFGSALVNALRFSGGRQYFNADYNYDGCVSHPELLLYLRDNGRSSRSGPRQGKIGEDDRGGVIALCSPWPVKGGLSSKPELLQLHRSQPVASVVDIRKQEQRQYPGMSLIPAGTFTMGCQAGYKQCENDEKPPHKVALDAFYIDQTEVTVAAYTQCVQRGTCVETDTDDGCNYGKPQKQNHPINCVNWHQAKAYCEAMGKRLPTEAEWEYAARPKDGDLYPWGTSTPTDRLARFGKGWNNGTVAVKSYPKGANGLYDMAGNVWEWVEDCYDSDTYKSRNDNDNDKVTKNPLHSPNRCPSGRRVLRGGSFSLNARRLRASVRYWGEPEGRSRDGGFRCVLSAQHR